MFMLTSKACQIVILICLLCKNIENPANPQQEQAVPNWPLKTPGYVKNWIISKQMAHMSLH